MDKSKKCISLDLAKKIQEIAKKKGIKLPESELWWRGIYVPDKSKIVISFHYCKYEVKYKGEFCYPAYDTSELGEMLPESIKNSYDLLCIKGVENWIVLYKLCGRQIEECPHYAKTEAEARGKMYLYLLENDLINKK